MQYAMQVLGQRQDVEFAIVARSSSTARIHGLEMRNCRRRDAVCLAQPYGTSSSVSDERRDTRAFLNVVLLLHCVINTSYTAEVLLAYLTQAKSKVI